MEKYLYIYIESLSVVHEDKSHEKSACNIWHIK